MNSCIKGANGERELAAILQKTSGYRITRGGTMSYGTLPDLSGLPNIHIEVKRVEKLNLDKAMNQAVRDSIKFHDGLPTIFHRRNNEEWLVTMRLPDWLKVYGARESSDRPP